MAPIGANDVVRQEIKNNKIKNKKMPEEKTFYETFYEGTYGPLDPQYGPLFIGYRVPATQIAYTTSPATAHQVSEVTAKLSMGMKSLELGGISPEIFEAIPKQQFKEIEQLGKLTGVDFTLHGPLIDPAGFSAEGFSEANRKGAEEQMKLAIERAHDLSPEGSIPVTFHASVGGRGGAGIPSTFIQPRIPEEEQLIAVVDRESGGIVVTRPQKIFEKGKEELLTGQKLLDNYNERTWKKHMSDTAWGATISEDRIRTGLKPLGGLYDAIRSKEIKPEELPAEYQTAYGEVEMGRVMCDDVLTRIEKLYNDARKLWENAIGEEARKKVAEQKENIEGIKKDIIEIEKENLVEKDPYKAVSRIRGAISKFNEVIKAIPPQTYASTDAVALEKTKETIANVALHGFKKFGENAPAISMENIFPGTVFSTGSELANLVKESREHFVKKAMKEGYSENEARSAAEKLIGATPDLGHMFMLRRYGYSPEMTVEEIKKVAPYAKQVHISDNFGFEHTELPPGMGEVPIKKMLEELEKAGYSGKKVIEVGSWWQHFKISPTPYVLEALGSPLYGMMMPPFWNQVRGIYGIPAGYSGGYGLMLPEQHFGIYGAGFATLPLELGGTIPKKGQGFAGAPME